MADRFTLIVNTPDREFYRGDVTMLELTTSEGDIGIYAGHIPLTAVIVPGEGRRRRQRISESFHNPQRAVLRSGPDADVYSDTP